MALIKCKECGHDVSTNATKCPSCGTPYFIPNDVMARERKALQRRRSKQYRKQLKLKSAQQRLQAEKEKPKREV